MSFTSALLLTPFQNGRLIPSRQVISPIRPAASLPFQRCPLCDCALTAPEFGTFAVRDTHVSQCLEEFHGLRSNKSSHDVDQNEDVRKIRFAKADARSIFSPQPQSLLATGSSIASKRRYTSPEHDSWKRLRSITERSSISLNDELWRHVLTYLPDLVAIRTCSKGFWALAERDALDRIAARLWMRVTHDQFVLPFQKARRKSTHVAIEHKSRTAAMEAIPCINVSLDGSMRGHVIIVNAGCAYQEFVRAWENFTGLQSDSAQFAVCYGNNIQMYLRESNFSSTSRLRMTGVFAYERVPPLSPQHIRVCVRWKGSFGGASTRFFGIPLMVVLPFRSTRAQVHRAVFSSIKRFLRKKRRESHVLAKNLPYRLLIPIGDESEAELLQDPHNITIFPCDNEVLLQKHMALVADFGDDAVNTVDFGFFGRLSQSANARSVSASSISLVEGLIERDCGLRILS